MVEDVHKVGKKVISEVVEVEETGVKLEEMLNYAGK